MSEVVYLNISGRTLFTNPENALMRSSKPQERKTNETRDNKNYLANNVGKSQDYMKGKSKEFSKTECSVEKMSNNSRLAGDLSTGVFIDHGDVDDVTACLQKCCKDPLCNVTYMIDKKCFSVHCYNKEKCKTIPALPMSLNTLIFHVRRHGHRGE